jgi:predicted DNA-binding transcriptional regulator AlpA
VRSAIEPSSPYLSTRQVCARLGGVTRQWLWLAVRKHGFPKPLKRPGGSRCFYPLDQILDWEATAFHRVAVNDNKQFTVSGSSGEVGVHSAQKEIPNVQR